MSAQPAAGYLASERRGAAAAGPAEPGAQAAPAVPAAPGAPTVPGVLGAPAGPAGDAGQHATADLAVLARAHWPEGPGDTLTPIPAFVVSSFNPLVAEVANRCLRAYYGAPPADPARASTTAIVLASRHGDVGTDAAVARALAERRRVPPLLFFQSNVNAVAGHVAARWGLAGPVVCTCPLGDPLADGLACAALLFEDGDASEALVIAADQGDGGESDRAAAVLVAAPTQRPGAGYTRAGQQEPGGAT